LSQPENDSNLSKDDFAVYKRTVYQKVLGKIFERVQELAKLGFAMQFGDGNVYIVHPGLFIISMDAEEVAIFMACKSHNADVPCPRCLVRHAQLHLISQPCTRRTTASMQAALAAARAPTCSAKQHNEILQNNGLHNVDVSLFIILKAL